jgi:1,4-dihydroxy-2-naphthoyl-CoA hydrolase
MLSKRLIGGLGYRGAAMSIPSAEQLNDVLLGFDRHYGLQLLEVSEELVRARVDVRDELKQPAGLIHGGLYASMAEAMASLATGLTVLAEGSTAMGLSNNTSFLRPVTAGAVHARATRLHRGRTTWVWDVHFSDDEGRLCAVTRMTIAVRALPA